MQAAVVQAPISQRGGYRCPSLYSQSKSYISSALVSARGHWWACHKSGKSEAIAAFVKRLFCKQCIGPSGEKRRYFKVEQTREAPDGPLLPGPDEVEWKRFVRGQRR